jgi:hypothetical protein
MDIPQHLIALLCVQHDCKTTGCTADGLITIYEDRRPTNRSHQCSDHSRDPSYLNVVVLTTGHRSYWQLSPLRPVLPPNEDLQSFAQEISEKANVALDAGKAKKKAKRVSKTQKGKKKCSNKAGEQVHALYVGEEARR